MSIEVLPLGVRCNLKCGTADATYCYQQPIRESGNEGDPRYDMDAMKRALEAEGYKFSVFGGEPLLMPIDDLEELWRWGRERFGKAAAEHGDHANSVQTNGTLVTQRHLRLFAKYDVSVGFSIDGPGELNDARWARSLEKTRKATERSLWALDQCLQRGVSTSLIVTMHRLNASTERLPRLLDWFRELSAKGLRHVNLHLLEVDMPGVREQLSLSEDENVAALLACARLQSELPIDFNPLTDMASLLKGEDQWSPRADGKGYLAGVNCTWNACDPYTTEAVRGVNGQGHRGNCGRTCKEGPMWLKASTPGFERYLSLMHTPQAYGGCSGCRFFYACKGNCPGEGLQGDWRRKTEHCAVLVRVFSALEANMVALGVQPFSLSPERARVEATQAALWQTGRHATVTRIREMLVKGEDPAQAPKPSPHGDAPHIDVDHGDHRDADRPVYTHGDHTDAAKRGVDWAAL